MSGLFEDLWSGDHFPLLPDLGLPFEGGVEDVINPLLYGDAPEDWAPGQPADEHPALRGQDVWMGSPQRAAQPLELSGSLSPLPTLRLPSAPIACVSPQDIFLPIPSFDVEDASEDAEVDYPHPSPPSSDGISSGSSFNVDLTLPDYTNVTIHLGPSTDMLSPASPSSSSSSFGSSPRSQKRKRSDDDGLPEAEKASPRTRRRSTTSRTGTSDDDESYDFGRSRMRRKSTQRKGTSARLACNGCGQDFGRTAELTRHQKNSCPARPNASHTTSKAKQCEKCGYELSRSDALVRHKDAGPNACNKYLAKKAKEAEANA